MAGSDRKRFCAVCDRSVYHLSVLTRRQAVDLLHKNAGKICGRIEYDERGTQIFAKERNPFDRLIQISVLGASAVASATAAPGCEVKVRVFDAAGAAVPNVTLKITEPAGTETIGGRSNDQGEFSASIAPGAYSLQVESAGFAPFRREITCTTSEPVSVEAPLQIGLTGEVVIIAEPTQMPLANLTPTYPPSMLVPKRPSVFDKLRSFFRGL